MCVTGGAQLCQTFHNQHSAQIQFVALKPEEFLNKEKGQLWSAEDPTITLNNAKPLLCW
jgi:hypothetical protein